MSTFAPAETPLDDITLVCKPSPIFILFVLAKVPGICFLLKTLGSLFCLKKSPISLFPSSNNEPCFGPPPPPGIPSSILERTLFIKPPIPRSVIFPPTLAASTAEPTKGMVLAAAIPPVK